MYTVSCKASYTTVLGWWRSAVSPAPTDRALRWLSFLPQALLRKATRGGQKGKIARRQVAYRFNCVTENNWAGLVEAWEKDIEKRQVRQGRREDERGEEEEERQAREVRNLLARGQVRRAMRRGTSHGLADGDKQDVQDQMKIKFPQREDPLEESVPKVAPIDSFSCLREALLSLQPGSSPGCGGCRPEYLMALGEQMEQSELELMEHFILAYAAGDLPAWFYRLWLSLSTVPLFKNEEKQQVRPLGIRHTLVRLAHAEVIGQ